MSTPEELNKLIEVLWYEYPDNPPPHSGEFLVCFLDLCHDLVTAKVRHAEARANLGKGVHHHRVGFEMAV